MEVACHKEEAEILKKQDIHEIQEVKREAKREAKERERDTEKETSIEVEGRGPK